MYKLPRRIYFFFDLAKTVQVVAAMRQWQKFRINRHMDNYICGVGSVSRVTSQMQGGLLHCKVVAYQRLAKWI